MKIISKENFNVWVEYLITFSNVRIIFVRKQFEKEYFDQKKWAPIVEFLVFREILTPIFPTMQIETFNHAEGEGDAQEKQACS